MPGRWSLGNSSRRPGAAGDGVNDAPALRLADVGVAVGDAGTEVARQASDVVVTDDDFSTLVEALVEGRGFWRNIRQALGLLLGAAPLRGFLGLALPTPAGLALVGGATAAAPLVSRALPGGRALGARR